MTDLEKGAKAYDKGDYITAFQILEPLAQQNDLEAMLMLGFMLEAGKHGILQDYSEAFKWYQRSAQGNNAMGLFNYGRMYYSGFYVSKDDREAEKLFIQAVKKGHIRAQYYLGMLYEDGVGGTREKDLGLAHMWYNIAASKGHEDAAIARDRVAENLTTEEVNQAHESAWNFLQKEKL